ncbi:MAG: hypothetical protein IPG89_14170 [Bacteroidetes bacterium]|nr:hypothetical protein [Bacteroidota bacterium]
MKTILRTKSNLENDSFGVALALLLAFGIFISIALHVTPSDIISWIENFATHHFILVGLFLFFISLLVLRYYYKRSSHSQPVRVLRRKNRVVAKSNLVNHLKSKVNLEYQTLKSHFIGVYQVDFISFGDKDVLTDNELKMKREEDLNRAMKLGNSYKEKVKIYFKDSISNKHVYTSVWYVSSSHVTLKHGVVIPVKAIYQVKF